MHTKCKQNGGPGDKRSGILHRHKRESNPYENVKTAKARWGKLKTTMNTVNHIAAKKNRRLNRGDSFLRKFSTRNQAEVDSPDWEETFQSTVQKTKHRTLQSFVIHPSGGLMFYWLGIVTLAVLYNMWTCIAREAFREIQKGYMVTWCCLDGVSDLIYICDIFVQFRTGYLQQGLMVYDSSKLCKNYLKDRCFIIDLLCLLPLDFVQFQIGIHPMIRFPRFLKVYRTMRFMHMYESRTAYPNLLRVASLSHILFLGSHWFAAFYYLISEAEGFEGEWSYPKPEGSFAAVTRKYLASLYWSTLTLTTIGDLPPPDTNWQYAFVIISYLIGVFIFATIVGQVGNVITNRNASRQEFERLLDGAKFYMQMHNVPPDLQKRVQRWYDYVWTRGRLNCNDINSLGLLPDKLKTELALHVNLGTLKKVTIFQKCRPEFLHDLMLKMRAYIFTPGDLICRRGEVAREMFIIADGVVEILGENSTVLTQMSTGDFFGEIGILNLDGGINRRTADVRSVGYSELFVLSREDVLAALKDHPDAEFIIREYGQRRLKETEEHRKLAKNSPCSPDPSPFRGLKGTNKIYAETSAPGKKHLPHVKCLPRLPQMSPKLRKIFNSKQKKPNRNQLETENPYYRLQTNPVTPDAVSSNSNGDESISRTSQMGSLEVIQEKDASENEAEDVATEDNEQPKAKLSDIVLSLLKTKRKSPYLAVKTEDDASEKLFANITIDNLKAITTGTNSNAIGSNRRTFSGKEIERKTMSPFIRRCHSESRNNTGCVVENKTNTLNNSTPTIVLTKDTDRSSSSGSSDSDSEYDEVFNEAEKPSPNMTCRNHIARKSSPCILSLPTTFTQREDRKYSSSPPLDLPIEVPTLSNFRGISGNTQEISNALDRFKSQIMQRLEDIETTNKQTQNHLQEVLALQEKIIKNMYKKLSMKDKTLDSVVVTLTEKPAESEVASVTLHKSSTVCDSDSSLPEPPHQALKTPNKDLLAPPSYNISETEMPSTSQADQRSDLCCYYEDISDANNIPTNTVQMAKPDDLHVYEEYTINKVDDTDTIGSESDRELTTAGFNNNNDEKLGKHVRVTHF